MTEMARKALRDSEYALDLLDRIHDPQHRRVIWAAIRGLVRQVGVELRRSAPDNRQAKAVWAAYRRWRVQREANEIFWLYIEASETDARGFRALDEREEREICDAAILWWHHQLRLIEMELA